MSAENYLVLGILGVSLILFLSERLRVDVVALLTMLALSVSGILTPEEAFSGFSNPAVVTVWAIFIVSGGIIHSGLADRLARLITRVAGTQYLRLLMVVMLGAGVMSAFMNNVGAVAILLPAVLAVAAQAEIPPSRLLIPLAWASLLGGNMTLIGTPPNILANSILEEYAGLPPMGFFDFLPMGIIVLLASTLYMLLVGRHLLPSHGQHGKLAQTYHLDDYLAELRIPEGSPLAGRVLAETGLGRHYDVHVIHIYAADGHVLFASPGRRLNQGDILLVQGAPHELTRMARERHLVMLTRRPVQDLEHTGKRLGNLGMGEVVLAPKSTLDGKTLRQVDFRTHYGLTVMGIRRQGDLFVHHLADEPLQFGDALLVEGPLTRLAMLQHDQNLLLTTPVAENTHPRNHDKAPVVLAIIAFMLFSAITGLVHIAIAMLAAGLLMVILGVLDMNQAIASIDWKSVFLVAGMLPLGIAMQKTGTALLLAKMVIQALGGLGPMAVLMGLYVLTVLLTTGMSNAAVAVLMTPIALDVARTLGASPYPFALGVVLAASNAFMLPIGHQANVIVMGPGEYRFADYFRAGWGLNLFLALVVAVTLPLVWPLYP
ncbi:MAG: hypothetical protein D6755_09285 [Anaerolineae bacterium]|nr:MAG: hypothetical protein D6755_09285 [Anaerolineae bacterium]